MCQFFHKRLSRPLLALVLCAAVAGCAAVTSLEQPLVLTGERDLVWRHSQDVLRQRGFRIERAVLRSGVIETEPRVSSQWFELWGRDVATAEDRAAASLHTIRRRVSLVVSPTVGAGPTAVTCRVAVERLAPQERPIAGPIFVAEVLHGASGGWPGLGMPVGAQVWTDLGTDEALAAAILADINRVVTTAN